LAAAALRFFFSFLLGGSFSFGGGFGLGCFVRFQLGQTLLLLAQFRFLTCDQFRLLACFFFAACDFRRVDHRRGAAAGGGQRFVALDEGTRFLDGDLDGAGLAIGIGLLDLGGFLARQRDFLLLFAPAPWVRRRCSSSLSLSSFDNGSDAELSRRRQNAAASAANLQASSVRWQIGLRCYSPFSPLFYVSRR
jgi:hypothetical protein